MRMLFFLAGALFGGSSFVKQAFKMFCVLAVLFIAYAFYAATGH